MDLYRPASYIQNLDNLLLKSPVYCELLKKIKKTGTIEISGIKGSADSFLAYSIFNDSGRPLLLILPDNDSALRAFYDLQVFFNEGLLLFPALEELEGVRLPPSKELKEQRLSGLKDLLQKKIKVAVFSRQSFTQPVPSKKEFSTAVFKLKKEKELNLLSLVEQLITAGYKMEAFVERKGDISVRGGILDIYSLTEEHPVRIDFFGDNIDTIRVFDLLTQKSTKEIEEIEIYPASEDSFKKGKVTEYLLENTIIYVEEPLSNEFSIPKISDFPVILNQRGTDGINIKTKSFPSFNGNAGLAIKELQKNEAEGTAVFLLFNSNGEQERFAEILTENNAVLSVKYLTGELHGGFHFVEAGVLVVTDNEIFGRYGNSRPATKRRRRFFKDGAPVKSVFEINTGEAVVHENYGIGRFLGLSSLELSGTKKDFVTLEYLNGDKLYIPVEDINKIQKYVGFEETPVLSNLGTSQWEKAKEKVKEDVKKMADDLLLLYAARETLKGHAFPPDTTWQKEFEDSFIYEETKDQLRAISEVKEDMEQGRPIDRLVCGDVGFGKTEVALRAAFKCALEGKQVAFVCPTTILAEQHYKTFKERMAEYPVSIAMLSRFSAKKEQGKTLEKLKAGTVDIVVGTHRLLQEDIVFKDLGMLILDDEQKFGVGQKEKLKKLRKTVYCISLSATPIPRTLYLSLSGIREISNINTPPSGRMAIQTYVIEYNEKIIRGAINKELARGGEVYYVYNKVKTIQRAASRLQRLVPEARVAVAHGQLPGPRLEKIMMDFYNKKYTRCSYYTRIKNVKRK